jgi:hypothetical protein
MFLLPVDRWDIAEIVDNIKSSAYWCLLDHGAILQYYAGSSGASGERPSRVHPNLPFEKFVLTNCTFSEYSPLN